MAVNAPVAVEGAGDPAADFNALRADVIALDAKARAGVMPVGGAGGYMWDYVRDFGAGVAVANGNAVLVPISIGFATSIASLFAHVSTAGSAGSVVRLGMYRSDGTSGGPGTLVKDAGTVDSTTTGGKEAGFTSLPIEAGVYWFVAASQGGSTVNLGGGSKSGKQTTLPSVGDYLGADGQMIATGITGALPATWSAAINRGGGNDGLTMAVRLG